MIEKAVPPFAADWPSLADATKIVPKITRAIVTRMSTRAVLSPRGRG